MGGNMSKGRIQFDYESAKAWEKRIRDEQKTLKAVMDKYKTEIDGIIVDFADKVIEAVSIGNGKAEYTYSGMHSNVIPTAV
jgi:hypothetical protein